MKAKSAPKPQQPLVIKLVEYPQAPVPWRLVAGDLTVTMDTAVALDGLNPSAGVKLELVPRTFATRYEAVARLAEMGIRVGEEDADDDGVLYKAV